MFGKLRKEKGQLTKSIKSARKSLAANSNDGRQAAYHTILPALELAQSQKLHEQQITLFGLLGDVYFQSEQYDTALSAYTDAIQIDGAIGNPEIHFRLGKTQFELGKLDRAADELTRAYMGAGKDIFSRGGEAYFQFLQTRLDPPAGGWDA